MKILTKHQCPECLGKGVSPDVGMNDINATAIQQEYQGACSVCKGERMIEEWMGAREFIRTYMDEKIKPE